MTTSPLFARLHRQVARRQRQPAGCGRRWAVRFQAGVLAGGLIAMLQVIAPAGPAAAAGDIEAGKRVYMKCRSCHQIGEGAQHTAGPELNGVIGRKAGTVDGYRFSDAMKNSGLTWDEATLRTYLKGPRKAVPGTRMIFLGLPKDKDIENLLAYLSQFDATGKTAE